jgi:hypothetical protein
LQQIGCNLRPRKPRFRTFAILLAQPDQVASPEEFSEWLFAADNFKGVSVIFFIGTSFLFARPISA